MRLKLQIPQKLVNQYNISYNYERVFVKIAICKGLKK